jgi:hypothetical protein
MRVSLLVSALALTFAPQAHALNLHWNDVSCSGHAARIYNATSFAPRAGVKRVKAYSGEDGQLRLVVKKKKGSTTFFMNRVRDEVDSLGRVTQVYEGRNLKLKLAYEGDIDTRLELINTKPARDKRILRVSCNSN